MLQCSREEHQAMVEAAESNEFQCGKEAREGKHVREQTIDVGCQLQIDVCVAIGFGEESADAIGLSIAPNVNADIGPCADNDANIDIRPELTKVVVLQSNQRLAFVDHHVDNED